MAGMKMSEAIAARRRILMDVEARLAGELDRALMDHGFAPKDVMRAVALVAEEAGEALKEALNATRERSTMKERSTAIVNLRAELAQTAAMALAVLFSLEERP